jgi:hypothetical protein
MRVSERQFGLKPAEAFEEAFTKVLLLARQTGKLKKVGGISVDGSKVKANAGKHKAVSYKRAGEIITELEEEVKELMKLAEETDGKGLEEGFTIPGEIRRREDRKEALEAARSEMERMYEEAKLDGSNKRKKLDEYQHNFTDGDSRIMKAGSGQHFEQCYNAQAAVDTEGSMLILGGYVTQHANDKQELKPVVDSVSEEVREADTVCADSGYYSEEAVEAVENKKEEVKQIADNGISGEAQELDSASAGNGEAAAPVELKAVGNKNEQGGKEGPEVFSAVGKGKHGRTVDDLKKKPPIGRPPKNMTAKEKMQRKLNTKRGKAIYKKRKETVEPVFGIIKSVMGFRQFMLRGINKVNTEWALVRLRHEARERRIIGRNLS